MTGGSRGIGAAIARAFAERGDRVAVHCRDALATAEVVRDSLDGDGHVVVRADLAVPAEVRAMVDAAAAGLDGLDVLVNNAGIYLDHPVLGTSYEEWQAAWQATLGVNLVGAANVTWCAVQHMTASGQRGGRIVNVGSRGAFRGEPTHPAYGASKAGLHAFGQSLAVALAPHGITRGVGRPGIRGDRYDRGTSSRRRPATSSERSRRSAGWRRSRRSRPRSCTSRRRKRSGLAAPYWT